MDLWCGVSSPGLIANSLYPRDKNTRLIMDNELNHQLFTKVNFDHLEYLVIVGQFLQKTLFPLEIYRYITFMCELCFQFSFSWSKQSLQKIKERSQKQFSNDCNILDGGTWWLTQKLITRWNEVLQFFVLNCNVLR